MSLGSSILEIRSKTKLDIRSFSGHVLSSWFTESFFQKRGLLAQSRLRWLGHVSRMEDNRTCKRLLYGELADGS